MNKLQYNNIYGMSMLTDKITDKQNKKAQD